MKKAVLLTIGMLVAMGTQARHPTLTRIATPGDPTFDIVIYYWQKNPDDEIKGKVGRIIHFELKKGDKR